MGNRIESGWSIGEEWSQRHSKVDENIDYRVEFMAIYIIWEYYILKIPEGIVNSAFLGIFGG